MKMTADRPWRFALSNGHQDIVVVCNGEVLIIPAPDEDSCFSQLIQIVNAIYSNSWEAATFRNCPTKNNLLMVIKGADIFVLDPTANSALDTAENHTISASS